LFKTLLLFLALKTGGESKGAFGAANAIKGWILFLEEKKWEIEYGGL
jgi:hypothetical protein